MKPIEDLPIIKKDTNQLDRIIPDNATNRTRSSSVEQVRSQFNEKLLLDKTNNVKMLIMLKQVNQILKRRLIFQIIQSHNQRGW